MRTESRSNSSFSSFFLVSFFFFSLPYVHTCPHSPLLPPLVICTGSAPIYCRFWTGANAHDRKLCCSWAANILGHVVVNAINLLSFTPCITYFSASLNSSFVHLQVLSRFFSNHVPFVAASILLFSS